ncbi:MAG: chemotaxis protein CheW [Leptospira sp.]|jgi:purine-binding chemotaxis protein CheW|nr:chemotaxis protein CheW [Leptospira sp.]
MNKESDWILFRIKDRKFATRASIIKEILWFLPLNLTQVGGKGIFASFPLRGEIVMVLDLRLFWGENPEPYCLEDSLILIEGGIAIPISDVLEVVSWDESYYTQLGDDKGILEERVYKGDVVSLLDLSKFYPQESIKNAWDTEAFQKEATKRNEWYEKSFLPFSETERGILKKRLSTYIKSEIVLDQGGLDAISVVRSGEEDFGIPLGNVLEFSDPSQLTPVPGMPAILHGCMNLRGDVLPVVSLSELMGQVRKKPFFYGKVVIIREEESQFGLLVDELVDVVYKKLEDKLVAPLGSRTDGGSILDSSYKHNDSYVNVLNISALFSRVKQNLGS